MSLRVAIDARELRGRTTGVGRYLRELLVRWAEAPYAAGAECVLLAPGPAPAGLLPAASQGAQLRWQEVAGNGGTFWEQGALAGVVGRSGAQVLFSPAYSTPLRVRLPVVLAMHDVSFAAHPEWYGLREGVRRRLLARWSAHKAAAIVTLTRFSASEIVLRLGVRGARVHVIPLAVDYRQPPQAGDAASASPAEVPEAWSDVVPSPTGVLYVGSLFARRNLPMLVAGVAAAAADVPGISLDVIGDNRTRPPLDLEAQARALGIGAAVRVRGYVDEAALAEAYRRNGIFAFLSSYEGFGLPPLEAMRAGLATVVLDTPVAREVYGDGAAYVPAGEVATLGRLLARLATDLRWRADLVERGHAVASGYQWAETAERTWRVLELAAGRHP